MAQAAGSRGQLRAPIDHLGTTVVGSWTGRVCGAEQTTQRAACEPGDAGCSGVTAYVRSGRSNEPRMRTRPRAARRVFAAKRAAGPCRASACHGHCAAAHRLATGSALRSIDHAGRGVAARRDAELVSENILKPQTDWQIQRQAADRVYITPASSRAGAHATRDQETKSRGGTASATNRSGSEDAPRLCRDQTIPAGRPLTPKGLTLADTQRQIARFFETNAS